MAWHKNAIFDAFEDEDIVITHAIELSFEEQCRRRKGKNVIDESQLKEDELLAKAIQEMDLESLEEDEQLDQSYLEEDEQIARALQQSVDSKSVKETINYRNVPAFSFLGSNRFTCAGCGNVISRGMYLTRLGRTWHPQCFRCSRCNHEISDHTFSTANNRLYHTYCYNNNQSYLPKCDVCSRALPSNYVTSQYWRQKYCNSHENDQTPKCSSCHRLEPRHEKYISLDDIRKLCLKCLDSAIMTTAECQPLFEDIQNFYEGLNMKVNIDFPMYLVERSTLNKVFNKENSNEIHTEGVCPSRPGIIPAIVRRPKRIGNLFTGIGIKPGSLSKSTVTEILILFGYPRLKCGVILAHEMMHAWSAQNGYRYSSTKIREGMAEVLGYMWLESEIEAGNCGSQRSEKGQRSPFEKELGAYFKQEAETNADEVYGDGFRAGHQAVEKYGLHETLQYIKKTGNFPSY